MTDLAKFLAGFSANQVLTHGAFVLGGVQFTLFGIRYDRGLNLVATVVWGRGTRSLRVVGLDTEAAAGMKRGKKNLTSSRRSAGAALERVLRGDELVLIPALVLLYLAGRVSFAAAYARGAAARAFGMARSPAPPPWRPRLPYSWRVDAL